MRLLARTRLLKEDDSFESFDIFGRGQLGRSLARLIEQLEDPVVIGLDAPWGAGKTTFLRLWERELKKRPLHPVYFNAYESDYHSDPFVALSAEILAAMRKISGESGSEISFLKKAGRFGLALASSGARISIRAATAGIIDSAELSAAAVEAIRTSGAEVEGAWEAAIARRAEAQKAILDFREEVKSFTSTKLEIIGAKALVVIVDELDRCRPDYSLSVLEVAKHFFHVENVHFVLGMNSTALAAAVKREYGADVDGREYLRRLIDFYVNLDGPISVETGFQVPNYMKTIWSSSLGEHVDRSVAKVLDLLEGIASAKGLSLRDQEKLINHLQLSLALVEEGTLSVKKTSRLDVPAVVGCLVYFKALEPQLFERAKRGSLTIAEVREHFQGIVVEPDSALEWMLDYWSRLYSAKRGDDTGLSSDIFAYAVRDAKDIVPVLAYSTVDRVLIA